jgi:hypothetical protein
VHERLVRTDVRPGERAVVLVDDALRPQAEQLLDALMDAGAPALSRESSGATAGARRLGRAGRGDRTRREQRGEREQRRECAATPSSPYSVPPNGDAIR